MMRAGAPEGHSKKELRGEIETDPCSDCLSCGNYRRSGACTRQRSRHLQDEVPDVPWRRRHGQYAGRQSVQGRVPEGPDGRHQVERGACHSDQERQGQDAVFQGQADRRPDQGGDCLHPRAAELTRAACGGPDGPQQTGRVQFSFLIQILRTETLAGVPSSSIPILPGRLLEEAGSSSIRTAISWPLRMWIMVPPRAMISYWFQSLILT